MSRHRSKRRLQLEAWSVALTIGVVAWCVASGLWFALTILWTLARMALGV